MLQAKALGSVGKSIPAANPDLARILPSRPGHFSVPVSCLFHRSWPKHFPGFLLTIDTESMPCRASVDLMRLNETPSQLERLSPVGLDPLLTQIWGPPGYPGLLCAQDVGMDDASDIQLAISGLLFRSFRSCCHLLDRVAGRCPQFNISRISACDRDRRSPSTWFYTS
ncbi:hypothetical protein N656DRAFT_556838 [Canariomyces notabilis]|uniref:Uncharacterized protein n=1 Tax=Canariomyces notabilis TaxID=2074819 RepID=A0AAN6TI76_9PEZI|nr:hypothetical protein N656DRAFT_556838 [Canariomyces arenarius]